MCLAGFFFHYARTIAKFNKIALIGFGLGLVLRTVLFAVIYLNYTPSDPQKE